jgi:hypothetical protein
MKASPQAAAIEQNQSGPHLSRTHDYPAGAAYPTTPDAHP